MFIGNLISRRANWIFPLQLEGIQVYPKVLLTFMNIQGYVGEPSSSPVCARETNEKHALKS